MTSSGGRRRIEIFARLLGFFPPGKMIDLGAGHGKFSMLAADAGWEVTAVDARTDRNVPAPGVTWVESDVREVDVTGFDLVACLGLFYHLTVPDQIDLLARCRGMPMIIDTHLANGLSTHPLSEEVEELGFTGRLYQEGTGLLSSWRNPQSFWPTPDSFHKMLDQAGYNLVLAVEPWYLPDRTFFLALPGSS
ncbi:MAG: class I SAM-dependent methyltransferase [Acidimicrobiia bacterium]